ncbi:MAG: NUDIX domain-containing protein [Minisyncoccia bacterium]
MNFSRDDKIKKKGNSMMHESAGGFLFFQRPQGHRLYVALLKNLRGEYVIPKGHLKRRESPEAAAVREVKEELSLNVNPQLVGKVGISNYTFTLSGDILSHKKSVHLYVFCSTNKKKIFPLRAEEFVAARWLAFQDALKKITFDRDNLVEARRLFLLDRHPCGGPRLDRVITSAVKALKGTLASNLAAIVMTGSAARKVYRDGWSDVDLLLVVERMNIKTKNNIAGMTRKLERKTKIHYGINVVTTKEVVHPNLPIVSLDGKTLQALVELKRHPDRLVYVKKGRFSKFYTPTAEEAREYSLANIGMFFRKNRRDLTAAGRFTADEAIGLKEILKGEIRASLTIVKLAIQYFGEYSEETPLLDQARKTFASYNFTFLKLAQETIQNWHNLNDKKDISELVMQADRFIEKFGAYVFRKVERFSRNRRHST